MFLDNVYDCHLLAKEWAKIAINLCIEGNLKINRLSISMFAIFIVVALTSCAQWVGHCYESTALLLADDLTGVGVVNDFLLPGSVMCVFYGMNVGLEKQVCEECGAVIYVGP